MLETLINIRAVTAVEQKPLLGYIPKICEIKISLFLQIKSIITMSQGILFAISLFPEMLKMMRQDIRLNSITKYLNN